MIYIQRQHSWYDRMSSANVNMKQFVARFSNNQFTKHARSLEIPNAKQYAQWVASKKLNAYILRKNNVWDRLIKSEKKYHNCDILKHKTRVNGKP